MNKYSVLNYIYTYDYTIQESLEIMIKHAEKLKFQYKGKWYPSFQNCCEEMGIPACTVKKCMNTELKLWGLMAFWTKVWTQMSW